MPAQVTPQQIARKFPKANLSALPTSDPGSGKPWRHGSGSIIVGAFTGGGNYLPLDGSAPMAGDLDMDGFNILQVQSLQAGGISVGGESVATTAYVDDNLNAGLQSLNAGNLASGTVPEARLSANVARRDQANTFVGTVTVGGSSAVNLDIKNASNSTYALFNGTNRAFWAGGDAFAVLTADGTTRLYNNGVLGWNNAAVASSGTIDVSLRRNATGPALEARAAGGLKACSTDGSASAPVSCSLVDIVWNGTNGTFLKYTDSARIFSSASSNTISIGATPVTFNVSAGTVGPTKVLLQSTASTTLSNTNVVLRPSSGVLEVMNAAESANAAVACSNLTASGYIDGALRPYTVAGLPLASASDGKECRVTDSTLAMTSANYGSTPSGGGSNKVRLFSNGTSWLLA